jgi:hypothetical protein
MDNKNLSELSERELEHKRENIEKLIKFSRCYGHNNDAYCTDKLLHIRTAFMVVTVFYCGYPAIQCISS